MYISAGETHKTLATENIMEKKFRMGDSVRVKKVDSSVSQDLFRVVGEQYIKIINDRTGLTYYKKADDLKMAQPKEY